MSRLDEIEARYTAQPIPMCFICGAPLELAAIDPGRLTYACSSISLQDFNDEAKMEHYRYSRRIVVDNSDPDVLLLVRVARAAQRLQAARKDIHAEERGAWGELFSALAALESEAGA